MEQDFYGDFQVDVTWFFEALKFPVSLTELCLLFWYGLRRIS